MDMIVISDSKLKIMLTPGDMRRLDISCESIDYDNSDTRAALKSILDEARCQTGVDLSGKRICIQVYPSREGGCEMFVNVLPSVHGDRRKKEYSPSPTAKVCRSQGIYCFRGELSRLLRFCAALKSMGYPGRSSLYRDTRSSAVYLVLDESGGRYSFISEYGGERRDAPAAEYISEHCLPIRENDAVEVLSMLC